MQVMFVVVLLFRQGYIVTNDHFALNSTTVHDCFQMKGICKNSECTKRDVESFVYFTIILFIIRYLLYSIVKHVL